MDLFVPVLGQCWFTQSAECWSGCKADCVADELLPLLDVFSVNRRTHQVNSKLFEWGTAKEMNTFLYEYLYVNNNGFSRHYAIAFYTQHVS